MEQITDLIGLSTPWRKIEYNWRDMALYALAIGAGKDDLIYTYEKNMKAVPSFAALPYYNAVNNEPQQPLPHAPNYVAAELLSKMAGHTVPNALHAGFQMVMHKPLDCIKGTLVHHSTIRRIYDRGGEKKGIMMEIDNPVYDESGQQVCLNTSYHIFHDVDGSCFPLEEKVRLTYPDRKPDYIVDSYISPVQNVLYRLTGDTNYVHVDPQLALKFADRPFMQGLSSFGYACRMAIQAAVPEEPERMKRLYVQMRSIAYPDTEVQLQGWKTEEKKMIFHYIDKKTGKAILDNCIFEWE